MKKYYFLFLVIPMLSASGCLLTEPFPIFSEKGVAQTEAVGGMPPQIAPVKLKNEENSESSEEKETDPQKVYVKPSPDNGTNSGQTIRHDTAYRPNGPPRVTPDQVTAENLSEMIHLLDQELAWEDKMRQP